MVLFKLLPHEGKSIIEWTFERAVANGADYAGNDIKLTKPDGEVITPKRNAVMLAEALRLAESPEEKKALIQRHKTRLFIEEMAFARCSKPYEAYLRCQDVTYSAISCMPPLEYFAGCSVQAARRLRTNCAMRFTRFQRSFEVVPQDPDWKVYLNDLTRCMVNSPSNLPEYVGQEGFLQKRKEWYTFRAKVLGDDEMLKDMESRADEERAAGIIP